MKEGVVVTSQYGRYGRLSGKRRARRDNYVSALPPKRDKSKAASNEGKEKNGESASDEIFENRNEKTATPRKRPVFPKITSGRISNPEKRMNGFFDEKSRPKVGTGLKRAKPLAPFWRRQQKERKKGGKRKNADRPPCERNVCVKLHG